MSAIQDVLNELVADKALPGKGQSQDPLEINPESQPFEEGSDRSAKWSIARKLQALSLANLVAILAMMGAVGLAAVIALDMREARMAMSQAQVSSAEVTTQIEEARLHGQRYSVTGDPEDWSNAMAALRATDEHLDTMHTVAAEFAEQAVASIAALEAQRNNFAGQLRELRTRVEQDGAAGATRSLADEMFQSGARLAEHGSMLSRNLRTHAAAMDSASASNVWSILAMLGVAMVIMIGVIILGSRYLSRDISSRLVELTAAAKALAKGDRSVTVPQHERRDEIGSLAEAMEVFRQTANDYETVVAEKAANAEKELSATIALEQEREEARRHKKDAMLELAATFEATVGEVVGSVAAAATQLQSTAGTMASAAEQSSAQSGRVAQSMEQASIGVTSAAAASDEFALSIGEISRQAADSAAMARKASDAAESADATISTLSTSAEQVGQIVELIQTIAQRTNLLALNASIEAARGGEAGRGFAVVASEVKELAAQTSRATEDVAAQIRTMQDSTGASVSALRAVGEQIKKLEATAISIASAVDQQSVASQDLARSIDMAAQASDEVAGNVGQVREASVATGTAARQVLGSAKELEGQASSLRDQANAFLARVRSA